MIYIFRAFIANIIVYMASADKLNNTADWTINKMKGINEINVCPEFIVPPLSF